MKLDSHLTGLGYISAKFSHELNKANTKAGHIDWLQQAGAITRAEAVRARQAEGRKLLKVIEETPAAYQKMRKREPGEDLCAYDQMQEFIGDDLDEHPDVAERQRVKALEKVDRILLPYTHSSTQTDARTFLTEAERLDPDLVATLRERAGYNTPADLGGPVDLDAELHPRELTDHEASTLGAAAWLVRAGKAQLLPEQPKPEGKPAEETASDWDMERYVIQADKRDARIAAEREADKKRREDYILGHGKGGIIHPTSAPSDPNQRHKEPAPHAPQNLSNSRYNFFTDESE
jgi:hypothetical protein